MASYTKEDFENTRRNLGFMTDAEVMQEYIRILRENEQTACTSNTDSAYNKAAEFINKAEILLSGYLARKMCLDNGYEV